MELTRRSGGRRAAHAGTWYDADCTSLKSQLHCWLDSSSKICDGRIKALICPHAGLRFSGYTAACAWKQVDPSNIKRIFLLGPSHYKYFIGVALPPKHCEEYLTPLGGLSLDTEVLEAFRSNGTFCELSPAEDEEEHSLELMLPFIRHIFPEGIKIIPMIVGELRQQEECQKFADVLIDYFLHDLLDTAAARNDKGFSTKLIAYSQVGFDALGCWLCALRFKVCQSLSASDSPHAEAMLVLKEVAYILQSDRGSCVTLFISTMAGQLLHSEA
ncbi:protein MEMO1 [Cyclospora cayetanensis]|uniref:Protein MEMO1 n=1 Tax=Cyclospora cayetanensis TaxID=88456 RepID=A0A6P6S1F8_9EIME|nr:protein MEMO1 [Cyclospora cayetanensis]